MVYRVTGNAERFTRPERLFDGINPPSDEAIKLLLEATQTSFPTTPIHHLPVELQNAVLDNLSADPIESARAGCFLNVGPVFAWKCGGRDIERQEERTLPTPETPAESHIRFGNSFTGIAYKYPRL